MNSTTEAFPQMSNVVKRISYSMMLWQNKVQHWLWKKTSHGIPTNAQSCKTYFLFNDAAAKLVTASSMKKTVLWCFF